jgi:hypothetical protein
MRALTRVLCVVAVSFSAGEALAEPVADSFIYPVSQYRVDQDFKEWNAGFSQYHAGEDWNGRGGGSSDLGDSVYAIANGEVDDTKTVVTSSRDSWGKYVYLTHKLPSGEYVHSLYAHLEDVFVEEGEYVERGQMIGTIGDADGYYPDAAHLHFEIRVGDTDIPGPGYLTPLSNPEFANYTDPRDFIDSHRTPGRFTFAQSGRWRVNVSRDYDMQTAGFRAYSDGDDRLNVVEATEEPWVWENFATAGASSGCYYPTYPVATTVLEAGSSHCLYVFVDELDITMFSDEYEPFSENDHQALQDMIEYVRDDPRYEGVIGDRLTIDLDWSSDWELRIQRFWFDGSQQFDGDQSERVAHATNKSNERYPFLKTTILSIIL